MDLPTNATFAKECSALSSAWISTWTLALISAKNSDAQSVATLLPGCLVWLPTWSLRSVASWLVPKFETWLHPLHNCDLETDRPRRASRCCKSCYRPVIKCIHGSSFCFFWSWQPEAGVLSQRKGSKLSFLNRQSPTSTCLHQHLTRGFFCFCTEPVVVRFRRHLRKSDPVLKLQTRWTLVFRW